MSYLEMSEKEIHDLVERGGLNDDMFFSLHSQAIDELSKTETAYNAVISYMLGKGYCEEPLEFLRCWNEGNFEALREEWPDAPEEIYLADPKGSNPLYKGGEMMTNKISAYKDLLKVVKKHSEVFDRENITLSPEHLKSVVEAMEVSERFGIPLQGIQSGTHLRVKNVYDDWTGLSLYGKKHGRTIGCSDNGKQPKSEWLFKISFPCGAYTFGGDGLWDKSYPKKTFDAFFEELKSFGAAFSDTMNNALYFREDNSKAVYEAFWGIFNKYKAMVADELKEQRKQELVKELEALEGN